MHQAFLIQSLCLHTAFDQGWMGGRYKIKFLDLNGYFRLVCQLPGCMDTFTKFKGLTSQNLYSYGVIDSRSNNLHISHFVRKMRTNVLVFCNKDTVFLLWLSGFICINKKY